MVKFIKNRYKRHCQELETKEKIIQEFLTIIIIVAFQIISYMAQRVNTRHPKTKYVLTRYCIDTCIMLYTNMCKFDINIADQKT